MNRKAGVVGASLVVVVCLGGALAGAASYLRAAAPRSMLPPCESGQNPSVVVCTGCVSYTGTMDCSCQSTTCENAGIIWKLCRTHKTPQYSTDETIRVTETVPCFQNRECAALDAQQNCTSTCGEQSPCQVRVCSASATTGTRYDYEPAACEVITEP